MRDLDRFARLFSWEFSGIRARRTISRLVQMHRIQASPGILEAAEFLCGEAEAAGLTGVKLHRYPVDGKSSWWTWKQPWFWTPKSAELKLIEPEEETLARFEDEPCHLSTCCAPTPEGGVTAEVVDVGRGMKDEDYGGLDVKGKVVLVSGVGWATSLVTRVAARKGAVGMITDSIVEVPPVRTRENEPDQIAYNRVWVEDDGSSIFCFNINYHQMKRLRRLMAENPEPLKVHAVVESTLGKGDFPALTGVIEGDGKKDEEVLFVAHICHPSPGANDNASGSALLLELARTWNEMISEGKAPRPARTIRFLWVGEWYGTIAYIHANPDWPGRLQAVICCDMVGEDQQICGGPLIMERTPDTLPSCLNDLAERFLERLESTGNSYFSSSAASLWKYQVTPYGGGSDHGPFTDSQWSVPTVVFGHWPDRFYHSSHDTVDKVDPVEIERVALAAFQVAHVVANAGPSEAVFLARETLERGLNRLSRKARDAMWAMQGIPTEDDEDVPYARRVGLRARKALEVLEYMLEVEKGAVSSVSSFAEDDPGVEAVTADCRTELEKKTEKLHGQIVATAERLAGTDAVGYAGVGSELSDLAREANSLVPERHWEGPLDMLSYTSRKLGWERTIWFVEEMSKSLGLFSIITMASLWVDGKRSLLEIARRVELGIGMDVDLDVFIRYFRDLEETGAVRLLSRKG
jgi:hypothetical protein